MKPLSGPGALAGLRVLDLTMMLSGPYCTMLLADQGADVIKIEPPEGDGTRYSGPFADGDAARLFGGYFHSINRGKRSLVIDLKQAAGKALLQRLVRDADVLVENFRSGVMERLGLGYELLAGINPRLVYAAIRGFGDGRNGSSPYEAWPAYDVVAQAMGGIMGITGPDAQSPMKIGPGVGDIFPGALNAFAILAAVIHARASGEGQFVDVSMTDAILSLCERIVYQYSYQGTVPHPEGNAHPMLCPFGLFRCRDGWVTIACPRENFWSILCDEMNRPELVSHERYRSNMQRALHRDEVNAEVERWTLRFSKQELVDRLGGKVPFAPVYDVADIFADPHFAARMLVPVEQPGAGRDVVLAGSPIGMSRTPPGIRGRGPLLGEHAEQVLGEWGLTPAEIAQLRAEGVIQPSR
ncbi:MAG TPA: CoA transferase [Pseudomonadales bacterium]|mgnify:FL=1|jgi:crotonobetainyl-CoA:carnitine CoA-transferase CaiB-like acyl-CoA transferase|nr:CoA transferase [Pseudomonadales bacterium]HMY97677.1 CoA transferase [Pseudomonadales bacterium]HMZ92357.1 CoA transferase [Pseudomonadales bacterium]HNF09809.1 CoA transferase [Pseudomonadales bacterium]HNF74866.1 CoA transferase [Pseudomonadales bacterium]